MPPSFPSRVLLASALFVLGWVLYAHDLGGINPDKFDHTPEHDPQIQRARPVPVLNYEDDLWSEFFNSSRHRRLYSLSTTDQKYFKIDFGEFKVYNPNILPHPSKRDTYIVAGLQVQVSEEVVDSIELSCHATFVNDTLRCTNKPLPLPVEKTAGHCQDDLVVYNFRWGPRDARMFHGLDDPYLLYGSLGTRNCLGLYLQNLASLEDAYAGESDQMRPFSQGVEIGRPPPLHDIEKNWFLFWDAHGRTFVHYDIYPQRTYAQLSNDGTVGIDLGLYAQQNDALCMAKYMPGINSHNEKIHQATNSLEITLCARADPHCTPNDQNTFIMAIFQYQTFFDWHAQYYPYVVLFERNFPFALHAISQKALWIHGKARLTNETESVLTNGRGYTPEGHLELYYMTSIAWKAHGLRYHGFIDDPLFLNFGIEDTRSGGIDILAGDLLQDLGLCGTDDEQQVQSYIQEQVDD